MTSLDLYLRLIIASEPQNVNFVARGGSGPPRQLPRNREEVIPGRISAAVPPLDLDIQEIRTASGYAPGLVISDVSNCLFVSDISSHGLNDKKMVEVAAFEERGLLKGELDHANDYP